MKRIFSFCLLVLLLLSLVSCAYDDMSTAPLPSATELRQKANDFVKNLENNEFTLRVTESSTLLQLGEDTKHYTENKASLYVTAKDGKAYLKTEGTYGLYEEWYAEGYVYQHTSVVSPSGNTIETKEKFHSTWDKEIIKLNQQKNLLPVLSDDELATAQVYRDGVRYICTYQMDPALHGAALLDIELLESMLGDVTVDKFEYVQVFNYNLDLKETYLHIVVTTTEQSNPVTVQVKRVADWTKYHYPEDVVMPEKMRGYTLVETTPDDNVGADE